VGRNRDDRPIHQYLPVDSFAQIDLGYATTEFSAKTYFLPFRETLSSFRFRDGDWEQQIKYRVQPRAIVGLHACDINALLRLDKVFERDRFPSPYYLSRRRNTFIVGIDHEPCEGAFCHALGTDTVTHGFDLFLTDLGDEYFVAIGTDRGYQVLHRVDVGQVSGADTQQYLRVRRQFARAAAVDIDFHNVPNLLDLEFESAVWQRWGDKCFSCGTCAMVCPTCYCHGVTEEIAMDFASAAKVRHLHSCNLVDFAEVAGGHNFRPTRQSRLKYRYYHQHRGFVEAYEEPKCVGCNRCGRSCLARINPVDVIRDLQEAHPNHNGSSEEMR
jgi:formate hydrogenlyase subunit 6/NADH:ubiquinone oxidoreductase subunit I